MPTDRLVRLLVWLAGGLLLLAPLPVGAQTPTATPPVRTLTPVARPTPLLSPTLGPSPTGTVVPTASPTASLTPTSTPTPTWTPRPLVLPPTPTLAWPTPAPTGYFVSRYLAAAPLSGPADAGVIRGRVMDWRGLGVGRLLLRLENGERSWTAFTAVDGFYQFADLPPGVYNLEIVGYPGLPARAVPLGPGQVVTIDFVEAQPVTPTPERPPGRPTPTPAVTPTAEPTPPPPLSPTPVLFGPPGPRLEDSLEWQTLPLAFLAGVGAGLGLAGLVLVVLALRRRS
jgi:hypothetical protein